MLLSKQTNRTWKESLESGNKGESVFSDWQESLNYFVVDVSGVDEYREQDIDYLVYADDDVCTWEIKSDYKLGNYQFKYQRMMIETVQNIRINSAGWYNVTKTDRIGYYDTINEIMYCYTMVDLREYIDLYYGKDKSRVDYIVIGNSSEGYVVYIEKFIEWLVSNDRYVEVYYKKENKVYKKETNYMKVKRNLKKFNTK